MQKHQHMNTQARILLTTAITMCNVSKHPNHVKNMQCQLSIIKDPNGIMIQGWGAERNL